jgi:hypothetical protein
MYTVPTRGSRDPTRGRDRNRGIFLKLREVLNLNLVRLILTTATVVLQ